MFYKKAIRYKGRKISRVYSKTRDIFDARLYSYTNKTQNWLFGAVAGEIGSNTFDHNFTFKPDYLKVENNWHLYYHSGNAICNADGNGYFFGLSDFRHDGCFCILSCKEC